MKYLLLFTSLISFLFASEITLTKEQEAAWALQTRTAHMSKTLPLGTFLARIVAPPALEHALSLPYETKVTKLQKAVYESVAKGDLIAEVSSPAYLDAQKETLENAIALGLSRSVFERQNRLCHEGIIAQKECIAARALLQNDQAKYEASRATLEAFGMEQASIDLLIKTKKLKAVLPIYAPASGTIAYLEAKTSQTLVAGETLVRIIENGALWAEGEISQTLKHALLGEKEATLIIHGESIPSQIAQISPLVNAQNQTRTIRFLLPENAKCSLGERADAKISIQRASLMIDKNALVKNDETNVVFVKSNQGFEAVEVEILGSDEKNVFLAPNPKLNAPIAVSALGALKNMMGE